MNGLIARSLGELPDNEDDEKGVRIIKRRLQKHLRLCNAAPVMYRALRKAEVVLLGWDDDDGPENQALRAVQSALKSASMEGKPK